MVLNKTKKCRCFTKDSYTYTKAKSIYMNKIKKLSSFTYELHHNQILIQFLIFPLIFRKNQRTTENIYISLNIY